MGRRPNRTEVLNALGGYQKTNALALDIEDLVDDLIDESDRGMVVILGSIVEDMLFEQVVKNFVRDDEPFRRDLRRPGSVLSNWTDNVTLAQALGIIDENDALGLEVINKMRNACAHSRQPINFKTPVMRDALGLLVTNDVAELIRTTEGGMFLRTTFVIIVSHLMGRIRGESKDEALARVQDVIDDMRKHIAEHAAASQKRLRSRVKKIGRQVRKNKGRPTPPRSSPA